MENLCKEKNKRESLEESDQIINKIMVKSEPFSQPFKEKIEKLSDDILKRMENSYQRLEKVLKAFNRIS